MTLVLCDSNCNWKLDDQPMGLLTAEIAKLVSISPGEHVLEATTTGGVNAVQTKVVIDRGGKIVDLRLKSGDYRQSKLQRAEAGLEPAGADAAMDTTWTDPATGLTWAGKDNGSDVNWHQANAYCSNLKRAGLSGWRLPTIEELDGIYDSGETSQAKWDEGVRNDIHIKGSLKVSGWSWSSSQATNYSGKDPLEAGSDSLTKADVIGGASVAKFTHKHTPGSGFPFGFSYNTRALCVLGSRERSEQLNASAMASPALAPKPSRP